MVCSIVAVRRFHAPSCTTESPRYNHNALYRPQARGAAHYLRTRCNMSFAWPRTGGNQVALPKGAWPVKYHPVTGDMINTLLAQIRWQFASLPYLRISGVSVAICGIASRRPMLTHSETHYRTVEYSYFQHRAGLRPNEHAPQPRRACRAYHSMHRADNIIAWCW